MNKSTLRLLGSGAGLFAIAMIYLDPAPSNGYMLTALLVNILVKWTAIYSVK